MNMRAPGAVLLVSCYELGHQPLGAALPLAFLERAGFTPAALDIAVEDFEPDKVARARFVGIYGSLLGVVERPRFDEAEVDLGPGDWLVLYTDGVTDEPGAAAMDNDELLALLEQTVHGTAESAARRLERALLQRCANVRRDDIALILVHCPER